MFISTSQNNISYKIYSLLLLLLLLGIRQHTWITEVLDDQDQHIERLCEGTLEAVTVQIVCMSDKQYVEPAALTQLKAWGVRTTSIGQREALSLYPQALLEMKRGREEGYVVVFENESTDEVVGLLKVKCVWYIICRSIRELTKSKLLTKHAKTLHDSPYIKLTQKLQDIEASMKALQLQSSESDVHLQYNTVNNLSKGDSSDDDSVHSKTSANSVEDVATNTMKSADKLKIKNKNISTNAATTTTTDSLSSLEKRKRSLLKQLNHIKHPTKNTHTGPRYCDTAVTVGTTLSQAWNHKFDFLQTELPLNEYHERKPKFISTARCFLVWYADKIDQGVYSSDMRAFTSRFPVIWDSFVAEGHNDSF